MSLADRLEPTSAPDARRTRGNHPGGFEPGVKFESGDLAEVTLQLREIPEDEKQWRAEINRVTGLTVPEHKKVELSQVRYWGDPESPFIYCRFIITSIIDDSGHIDASALLRSLRANRKPPSTSFSGDSTLVISWNDWQVGKGAGGGTSALAERLDAAYSGVSQRARELRKLKRDLGHLVVVGGGDIIEGCTIFPNQSFEIDTDRRGQIRTAVILILEGLDRLAPLFERVTVLAVGGNHGEHRIDGKRTTRHDNDDVAVFEHAAVAASRDDRLGHVNFVLAQDEQAKTIDVHGHILGTTHGHVFGKVQSGSVEQKAWNWFRNQAAGRQPVGDSDVLLTHHWHHMAMRDWGSCLWVQAPAMDGGSPFFTDYAGQATDAAMLTFVMTPEKRFIDQQLV